MAFNVILDPICTSFTVISFLFYAETTVTLCTVVFNTKQQSLDRGFFDGRIWNNLYHFDRAFATVVRAFRRTNKYRFVPFGACVPRLFINAGILFDHIGIFGYLTAFFSQIIEVRLLFLANMNIPSPKLSLLSLCLKRSL